MDSEAGLSLQASATIWMVGELDHVYSQKPPTDFRPSQPSLFLTNDQSMKPVGEVPVIRSSKLVIVGGGFLELSRFLQLLPLFLRSV